MWLECETEAVARWVAVVGGLIVHARGQLAFLVSAGRYFLANAII